jgi:hypothetical protein
MELYLDKRAVKEIRQSTADAIEEGDTDALMDDILEAFPEQEVEMLEQMLGGTDFSELISDIIDEWSGDDVDELFELLETHLGDHGIDLKFDPNEDDDDDDDLDSDDDDDFDDLDDYDEPGFDEDL